MPIPWLKNPGLEIESRRSMCFPKGRGSPQPAGMDHMHGILPVLFKRCFQFLSFQVCKNWESPKGRTDSTSLTKLPKQNRS